MTGLEKDRAEKAQESQESQHALQLAKESAERLTREHEEEMKEVNRLKDDLDAATKKVRPCARAHALPHAYDKRDAWPRARPPPPRSRRVEVPARSPNPHASQLELIPALSSLASLQSSDLESDLLRKEAELGVSKPELERLRGNDKVYEDGKKDGLAMQKRMSEIQQVRGGVKGRPCRPPALTVTVASLPPIHHHSPPPWLFNSLTNCLTDQSRATRLTL